MTIRPMITKLTEFGELHPSEFRKVALEFEGAVETVVADELETAWDAFSALAPKTWEAMVNLGHLTLRMDLCGDAKMAAAKWWEPVLPSVETHAERGCTEALYQLYWILPAVKPSRSSSAQALCALRRAGRNGHVDAMCAYGIVECYCRSLLITARRWLQRAAKNNHPEAHRMLGRFSDSGVISDRNLESAALHYWSAAKLGDWYAKRRLSELAGKG